MCCKNKPVEMQTVQPQWLENLGQQTASTIGGGLGRGATPMPPELMQAQQAAYALDPMALMGANIMSQMYGGMPYSMPQQGSFPGAGMPFAPMGNMGMGGMPGGMPPTNFGGGMMQPFGQPPRFDPYQSRPAI